MGILDDAIREHLDLKRKHGAREGDVQQLEDEAFGPPTRPDEPDFPERPPTGEEAVVAEAATEEGAAEPALDEAEPFAETEAPSGGFFDQDLAEPVEAPAPEETPSPAEEPEAIAGEPTVEHPAPEPPPEPEAAEPEAGGPEAGEAEVLEVDEEFEEFRETEGEDGEEEDVLEETPEFLRDTPENERLWFEQGEPQDFDFDDSDEGGDRPA